MSRQQIAMRLVLLLFVITGIAGLALLAGGMPVQWHYIVSPLPGLVNLRSQ